MLPLRLYFESKHVSSLLTDIAFAEFFKEGRIIIWIAENGYTRMILCSGSQKGYSSLKLVHVSVERTDIDLLDSLLDLDEGFGDSFFEGIKIANDEINLLNSQGIEVLLIRVDITSKNSYNQTGFRRVSPP
jgi:hypothetical protein